MGYTHYFGFNQSVGKLSEEVLKDVKGIVAKYADILRVEYDETEAAVVTAERIRFNGIGEDGHETFVITPERNDFCKTARKPYDLAVCEVLLVLRHHYKENFDLSSDGFYVGVNEFLQGKVDGEWEQALVNVREQFGYDFTFFPILSGSGNHLYYAFSLNEQEAKEMDGSLLPVFLTNQFDALTTAIKNGKDTTDLFESLEQFLMGSLVGESDPKREALFSAWLSKLMALEMETLR